MSSGWTCQYMGTKGEEKEWCIKLDHKCDPGCRGCVIYNQVTYSEPNISEDQAKKIKDRSDNPLGDR